jgi:hypothetical protein
VKREVIRRKLRADDAVQQWEGDAGVERRDLGILVQLRMRPAADRAEQRPDIRLVRERQRLRGKILQNLVHRPTQPFSNPRRARNDRFCLCVSCVICRTTTTLRLKYANHFSTDDEGRKSCRRRPSFVVRQNPAHISAVLTLRNPPQAAAL